MNNSFPTFRSISFIYKSWRFINLNPTKIKATRTFETSGTACPAIHSHISYDRNLQLHRCEHLRTSKQILLVEWLIQLQWSEQDNCCAEVSHYFWFGARFPKKILLLLLHIKRVFQFSLQLSSKIFFILRSERDTIKNVYYMYIITKPTFSRQSF
jgi:hypothetical protein